MLFGRKQKNPITIADKGVVEWKYATCGYCSTGCALEVGLNADGEAVTTRGPISQLMLAIPIILLYEVSILMAKMVEKGRPKDEYSDDDDLDDEDEDEDEGGEVNPA